MDDGRWVIAGAAGALGLAIALKGRQVKTGLPDRERAWLHATPISNAQAIVRSGVIRPGRPYGSDPVLLRDPQRWLDPFLELSKRRDAHAQVDQMLSPAFPGFTYFTTSRDVLEYHISTDRAVFEGRPDPASMWPDEDFIGPVIVAIVHEDEPYLKSVFQRYLEAPIADVLDWGHQVAARTPAGLLSGARQIPMDAYGRYPLQIAIGLSILSTGLREPKLAKVLRSGLPLTSTIAHRGPVPIVRRIS